MTDAKTTRKFVADAYAQAVRAESCCGSEPKGAAVKVAGYDTVELSELPPDAVVNSFGCGTPVAFAEIQPGQTVLDLGSGAGIDLLLAAKKVGPTGKVIGIDMTDDMIERARANIKEAGLDNVEVRKGIIEELPVESGSVDWVISNCVINLSPEKPRVFSEISRVLKSGGRISVSDIVADELPEEILSDSALYSSCIAGAIPEADYEEGLKAAGLADVSIQDRLVYGKAEVGGILVSEDSCCAPDAADVAAAIEGKVWSIRVVARKP